MRKTIGLLMVSLVCLLAGCGEVPHDKTVPASGKASGPNSSQAEAASPPAIPFEAEESLAGDPPEGGLSVFAAQKQLAAIVAEKEEQTLLKTRGLFYRYRGIETDEDGREYYRIDLCAKDKSGSKFVTLRSYSAGVEGTGYRQLTGGAWQLIGTNGPENSAAKDALWWGEYRSEAGTLAIANYNGRSFHFLLRADAGAEFEGVAAVWDQDAFRGEYMDCVFSLSKDTQAVTVRLREDRQDKGERGSFAGEYHRK